MCGLNLESKNFDDPSTDGCSFCPHKQNKACIFHTLFEIALKEAGQPQPYHSRKNKDSLDSAQGKSKG